MRIVNHSQDSVLADSFEECVTWWEQTKGMMFRREVVPLVFRFPKEQVLKLHSWFCRDSIDLVFLDENWEVVELQSEWENWSSYKSQKQAMFLLELPKGAIFRSGTRVGDVIHLIQ